MSQTVAQPVFGAPADEAAAALGVPLRRGRPRAVASRRASPLTADVEARGGVLGNAEQHASDFAWGWVGSVCRVQLQSASAQQGPLAGTPQLPPHGHARCMRRRPSPHPVRPPNPSLKSVLRSWYLTAGEVVRPCDDPGWGQHPQSSIAQHQQQQEQQQQQQPFTAAGPVKHPLNPSKGRCVCEHRPHTSRSGPPPATACVALSMRASSASGSTASTRPSSASGTSFSRCWRHPGAGRGLSRAVLRVRLAGWVGDIAARDTQCVGEALLCLHRAKPHRIALRERRLLLAGLGGLGVHRLGVGRGRCRSRHLDGHLRHGPQRARKRGSRGVTDRAAGRRIQWLRCGDSAARGACEAEPSE